MKFKKLFVLWAIYCGTVSAAEYRHEVRKVISNQRGYQEAWVKIENPDHDPTSRELPLEVSLPLCNKNSVRKLDEYCVAPDGAVARVSAIRGNQVSFEEVDLSTGRQINLLAAAMKPLGSLRMPASAPEVDVVCEASCPQMDFKNECKASGATRLKAYRELAQVINEKKEAECKNCNLRAVICDGSLFRADRAPLTEAP